VLDQRRAKGPHGAVLLDRIAAWHIDGHRQAVTPAGEGKALTVIAARG